MPRGAQKHGASERTNAVWPGLPIRSAKLCQMFERTWVMMTAVVGKFCSPSAPSGGTLARPWVHRAASRAGTVTGMEVCSARAKSAVVSLVFGTLKLHFFIWGVALRLRWLRNKREDLPPKTALGVGFHQRTGKGEESSRRRASAPRRAERRRF